METEKAKGVMQCMVSMTNGRTNREVGVWVREIRNRAVGGGMLKGTEAAHERKTGTRGAG